MQNNVRKEMKPGKYIIHTEEERERKRNQKRLTKKNLQKAIQQRTTNDRTKTSTAWLNLPPSIVEVIRPTPIPRHRSAPSLLTFIHRLPLLRLLQSLTAPRPRQHICLTHLPLPKHIPPKTLWQLCREHLSSGGTRCHWRGGYWEVIWVVERDRASRDRR